jgi:hypothetical protein
LAGPPPINSCAKQLQAHPPPRTTHNMLCPLCLLLSGLGQAAAYASGFQPDSTSDQPFVCDYRSLAWEFAKKVQPSHDATLTFDALMLGSLCNQTRPPPAPALPTGLSTAVTNPAGCSIYVSAAHGSDSHDGKTSKTAKATVGAGIEATRKVGGATRTLCVGGGTYYLTGPLSLTAADSGLTIQGEAPGRTWISGATELPKLTWEKYIVAPAVTGSLNALQDTNNQQGCDANSTAPTAAGGCGCSHASTAAQCEAKCQAMGAAACKSYAWSPAAGNGRWSERCCIHADDVWKPFTGSGSKGHVCGKWVGAVPAKNVWKATLPAGHPKLPAGVQLRVGGVRSSRARFPDSNPELEFWPRGWVPNAQTWLPAKPPKSQPQFVRVLNRQIQVSAASPLLRGPL